MNSLLDFCILIQSTAVATPIHSLDLFIILGYLVSLLLIGIYFARKASESMGNYYLGGNTIPWYRLGLSNASGMFDISGTMWLVMLAFVYGLKSIWIPWLWPVFNQIFLMVFLSAWLRRSGVTTGAQWINFRFGTGRGAQLSHAVVVVFAIVSGLGFLAYGFVGLGKFMEIFIPWELVNGYLNLDLDPAYIPHFYGITFTIFAVIYTLLGGMNSIVWADVLQYLIMTVSAIAIGIIAFNAVGANGLVTPEGWTSPFFGWSLNLDWTGYIPEVQQKLKEDGYELFTAFFMMMVFKGIFVSAAGPAPNYDMQKILSTRKPSEACKMSGFVSVVLMPVRYIMIAGFAALGIIYYERLDLLVAGALDFEQILPSAIDQFVPVGLMGFLLAGLLAAFMSTFSGTLNAAQVYITHDIYLKYLNPKATQRNLQIMNYVVGFIIVLVSIFLGMAVQNVNQILQLIVSALWGGYTASNVLKWYWWRFNAYGFFFGMAFGMLASLIPILAPQVLDNMFPAFQESMQVLFFFPVIFAISLVGCFVGSYCTKPGDMEVLAHFYEKVKPWGLWGPVKDFVQERNPEFVENKSFWWDVFNVIIGVIWQTCLIAAPMYLVIRDFAGAVIATLLALGTTVVLKYTWWDRLEQFDD